MRTYHNIEKSGFHAGEYVGYASGLVYRITKSGDGWQATWNRNGCAPAWAPLSFRRKTMAQMSATLDTIK